MLENEDSAEESAVQKPGAARVVRVFTRVQALRPSPSAFTCFLGLDTIPDISPLMHAVVDGIGFGIAVNSRLDDNLSPPGHTTVSLTSLVPADEAKVWSRQELVGSGTAPGSGIDGVVISGMLAARAVRPA